jgi:hypothetical protein
LAELLVVAADAGIAKAKPSVPNNMPPSALCIVFMEPPFRSTHCDSKRGSLQSSQAKALFFDARASARE